MESELFTPRSPEVGYAAAGVPPPAALYIGAGEYLIVDTWSSASPARLTITARVLAPDGRVHTGSWSHTPANDRTRATTRHGLAEGFLLGVTVSAIGAAYRRGHCWCQVGIQRGAGAAGVVHGALISDYLTGTARLAWPGGLLRSSADGPGLILSWPGADPAAGAEWSVTVPAGAHWRSVGAIATLVTDATVVNRVVSLIVDNGATALYQCAAQTAQTASLTVIYSFGAGLPSAATAGGVSINPLSEQIYLAAGFRIRSSTAALQAGDNWGAPQLLLEEWIEP